MLCVAGCLLRVVSCLCAVVVVALVGGGVCCLLYDGCRLFVCLLVVGRCLCVV